MATSSTAESDPDANDSPSGGSRLETAGRALQASFLGLVVILGLVPAVGVLAGVAPFPGPDPTPYFAFLAVSLAGTVAFVAAEILDA